MIHGFVTLGLALIPGMLACWSGRRLTRVMDDPSLSERVLARQVKIHRAALTTAVVMILFQGTNALWGVPVMLLGGAAGGFPTRRVLLDESWTFPAYLLSTVRFWIARRGLWVLLAAAPSIIGAVPSSWHWSVAGGLALMLLLWDDRYPEITPWILGARPLDAPASFAAIVERAGIHPPRILQWGATGGGMLRAFAVFSWGRAAVVFSRDLLCRLDPEEQTAVFAHEIAHLAYLTPRRLMRPAIHLWVLIALNTLCVPFVLEVAEPFLPLWGLMTLIVLVASRTTPEAEEDAADQRAVTLCGSAEALIRALAKLRMLSRLPSPARRIDTIRRAAGSS